MNSTTVSFRTLLAVLSFFCCTAAFSQSNIQQTLSVNSDGSAAHASAQLDVSATDKGMLVPRMTTTQRTAIASPATGLLVFDTTTNTFWFFNGTAWVNNAPGSTLADTDGDTKIQVEESPDEDIIRFDLGGTESMVLRKNAGGSPRLELTNGLSNNFVGTGAGIVNTTGNQNAASGFNALNANTTGNSNTATGYAAMFGNNAGSQNTANGTNALYGNSGGNQNTALGVATMYQNSNGNQNTAAGFGALYGNNGTGNTATGAFASLFNSSGTYNTANGHEALYSNTSGWSNVALGKSALYFNTTRSNLVAVGDSCLYKNGQSASDPGHASANTAVGSKAMFSNTIGSQNTALGIRALYANTSGSSNIAIGPNALFSNATGFQNLAVGIDALHDNTGGEANIAIGIQALYSNVNSDYNAAIGYLSLFNNTSGSFNTAVGGYSMLNNVSGSDNTASGYRALHFTNAIGNSAYGVDALYSNLTGANNTAMGKQADDDSDNNQNCVSIGALSNAGTSSVSYTNAIAIGYDANTAANNYARIGNASVSSIGGQVNWSNYSDGRFKRNVQENVAGLEFIKRLRPVTYQWDIHALNNFMPSTDDTTDWASKYDIEKIRFAGFIAQEVEQAAAEVDFEFSGVDKPQNEMTPYALRYAEFVVPLVKAVQEQQAIIERQQKEIGILQAKLSEVELLKAQMAKLEALLLQKQ